jgi:hypothetical protein
MMSDRAKLPAALAQPRIGAFLLQGLFWNVALFALIRLTWVDRHIVSGLIGVQQTIVTWYAGAPQRQGEPADLPTAFHHAVGFCHANR